MKILDINYEGTLIKIYEQEAMLRDLRALLLKCNLPRRTNTAITGGLDDVMQEVDEFLADIEPLLSENSKEYSERAKMLGREIFATIFNDIHN